MAEINLREPFLKFAACKLGQFIPLERCNFSDAGRGKGSSV